ncbi:DNA repair protein RecO [Flavobacterium sp. NRK F10]|uniref:DNA repair protein RecO n=1 Tax=Flavobacterium sediminis TaxID=2201181 RepID=A0A2U8QTP8_9FLAO|nr:MULTISPECIES: DNA repair protein RecO [Flavobacterium]AWM13518.1 DNA repair protein RecO [Flavobacterium sediminis]MCO6174637.1 DNA repair protein RecO [Flavobacterium sp. NRK F10]
MLVKTKAIVISSLKYQEKSLIVKCLTVSDGLKSYFIANAFTGKKNQQKSSFFQPLTILGIEAYHKNKGTLERFKEIQIETPYQTIHQDIYKTTITLFLSDMLHHALKEDGKNETLFTFLETALTWLDSHDEVSNFHLITLLQLTRYLGFYPQSDVDLPFFEMTEGIFVPFQSLTCLSEEETKLFKTLLQLRFSDDQKVFSGSQRQKLLKMIVDYYSFNIEGFRKPKSLEVLKEVFG